MSDPGRWDSLYIEGTYAPGGFDSSKTPVIPDGVKSPFLGEVQPPSLVTAPKPVETVAPPQSFEPKVSKDPITDEEIRKYAISMAKLSAQYPTMGPDKDRIAEEIRLATTDRTGTHARMMKKSLAIEKAGTESAERSADDKYVQDINKQTGVMPGLGIGQFFMPELKRAGSIAGARALEILGSGEQLARDFSNSPTQGLARLSVNASRALGAFSPLGKAVEDITGVTGKADAAVSGMREAQLRAAGADDAAILADRAARSFGPSNAPVNFMTEANRRAEEIRNLNSNARFFDDGTTAGKVKGVIADTPGNIFGMIPDAALGGAIGGPVSKLSGAKVFKIPVMDKIVKIEAATINASLASAIPEAASEAQASSMKAREEAIKLGVDPDIAGRNAWANTFAGNLALLGVTNHYGDGKAMLSSFMKKGEKEVVRELSGEMAKEANKRFGKEFYKKIGASAKELGIEAFSEGFEEWAQKIIGDMAANPKVNTWDDFKNVAFSQEAALEFLGGALTGPIVGGGSRMLDGNRGGKEKSAVTVESPKTEGPIKADSGKARDGETLYNAMLAARDEADVPTSLSVKAIDVPLKKAAGLNEEQEALSKELSFIIKSAPVNLNPIPWYAQTQEGQELAQTEEGQAKLKGLAETYNKLLAAHQQSIRSKAESFFTETLSSQEEIDALNSYMENLNKVPAAAPAAPAGLNVMGGTTESGAVQGPVEDTTLNDDEYNKLPIAYEELQKRKAAVDKAIADGKIVDDAAAAKLNESVKAEDGKEKFNLASYKKAKEKLIAATKTMSPKSALALMTKQEQDQIRLGQRFDALRKEEVERLRKELHAAEEEHVAETHSPGRRQMLAALRELQQAPGAPLTGEDIDISTDPNRTLGLPFRATRRVVREGGHVVGPNQPGTIRNLDAGFKSDLLDDTFNSLSPVAQIVARKHGATSVRMMRALRAILAAHASENIDTKTGVEALLKGMRLSKEEQRRVDAAYNDAVFFLRVQDLHLVKAARLALEQYNTDRKAGLDLNEQMDNLMATIAANKSLAKIHEYASSLGISPMVAMEAVISVERNAKKEPTFPTRSISKAAVFPNVVKALLREIAATQKGDAGVDPVFDTTTASGKVRAAAYAVAKAYIKEQLGEWRSYIASKGHALSYASKQWDSPDNKFRGWRGREVVRAFINKVLEEKFRGMDKPRNDGAKAKKSDRNWLINDADYSAVTKALVEAGLIKVDGKSYSIVGMGNASETALGIDPAMARKAWMVAVPKNDPKNIKIPTMDELTAGLTPKQIMVLQAFYGIGAFSQNYHNIEMVGRLIGKTEETARKLLDHATRVVASKFPNMALMAESYANEISRLMEPGAMFEDEYTVEFRENRLAELRESMELISKLPGAFNAYTQKGGAANEKTSDNVLINKGFFPTLRDKLIDMGVPDADLKEREEAKAAFDAIAPEYHAASSKNPQWRSIAEQQRVNELKPAYAAARDRYLASIGRAYMSVSPETRKMLDFVKGSIPRRGIGLERGSNREAGNMTDAAKVPAASKQELASVKAIDRKDKIRNRLRRKEARAIANMLGDIVTEAFTDHFGEEAGVELSVYEVGTMIADAYNAYMENPNTPLKSAFTSIIMGLENSDLANEVGMNSDGRWIIQNNVVDKIRASLKMRDTSKARREDYKKAMDNVQALNAALEEAEKKRRAIARKLREAQADLDSSKGKRYNLLTSISNLSRGIAEAVFKYRLTDPGNKAISKSMAIINNAITMVEEATNPAGYEIPGYANLVANMRSLASTNSLEAAEAVRKSAPPVVNELKDLIETLRDVASTDGQYASLRTTAETQASATYYANMLESAQRFIEMMNDTVSTGIIAANSVSEGKGFAVKAGLSARPNMTVAQIFSDIDAIAKLRSEEAAALAEVEQKTKIHSGINGVLNKANTVVHNAEFKRNAAEKEAQRLSDSVLPASEAEIREILGGTSFSEDLVAGSEDIAHLSGDNIERFDEREVFESDETEGEDAEDDGGTLGIDDPMRLDRKGRDMARELSESGIGLSLIDTAAIARRIVSSVRTRIENSKVGRLSALELDLATADPLTELVHRIEAEGVSESDGVNMMVGMGAVAELVNSKHANLIQYKSTTVDENGREVKKKAAERRANAEAMVEPIFNALVELDTQNRGKAITMLMAVYAVENITGVKLAVADINKAVIEELAANAESNTAKELEKKKADEEKAANIKAKLAEARESAAAGKEIIEYTRETLANAEQPGAFPMDAIVNGLITRASNAPYASRMLVADMIEAFAAKYKNYAKNPLNTDVMRKNIKSLRNKNTSGILQLGLGVDFMAAAKLSESSPEGAAFLLAAGVAYLGYKVGMQYPTFNAVMTKIGARYTNTVSEIAAKIKGFAKGISDYVARLMAAVFKDTNGKGLEPTRTKREVAEPGFMDRPTQDTEGFITADGIAQMNANIASMPTGESMWKRYRLLDGTKNGRIFSADVLESELLHPGGGLLAWHYRAGERVSKQYADMLTSMLRRAAQAGIRTAVFVGGNGAGKSTIMSNSKILNRYGLMQETSANNSQELAGILKRNAQAGVVTDMVYVIRPLPHMIEGAIRRGIEEQRLGYAEGFADTLINGMINTISSARTLGLDEEFHLIDAVSRTQLRGEQAIARLEQIVSTLNRDEIVKRYRDTITAVLNDGVKRVSPTAAVRGYLEADAEGRVSNWVAGILRGGNRSEGQGRARIPSGAWESLVSGLEDPSAVTVDEGSLAHMADLALDLDDPVATNDELRKALLEAGDTSDGGVKWLNAGLNLRDMNKWVEDQMAPAIKRFLDRRTFFGPVDKTFTQYVHRFAQSRLSQLQDVVRMHIYTRDSITGALQPLLGEVVALRDAAPETYRSVSLAVHDSTVQERKIQAAELRNRYGMDDAGVAMYEKVVKELGGIQKIVSAAFDQWAADAVNAMRADQEKLEASDENYKKNYMAIEDQIEAFEKEYHANRGIITKNPVFISLLRNPNGNRRLELHDPRMDGDNKRIGMTHLVSKRASEEVPLAEREHAINEMLRQHAHKLWSENGRAGSPERIEAKLKSDYDKGLIQAGYSTKGEFVGGGKTLELTDSDHLQFVKMAGGMVTTEVLKELLDNRGAGISSDARDSMMRDLRYMSGASEVKSRLKHTRGNDAGYSEDLIMSLGMHARSSGYMVASLKHSNETREWLDAFHDEARRDDKIGEAGYQEAFHYMLSSISPQGKGNIGSKAMGFVRNYTAYRALFGKASFAFAQTMQGLTTSRPHMVAMYGTSYSIKNGLYHGSAKAARSLLTLTMGLGKDLSMVDPAVFDQKLDSVFTYENFKGVWKDQAEADRMIPVAKAVMRQIIHGNTFKDVNVGMQIGIDDATSSNIDRITGTSKFKKAKDAAKDVLTYGANKGENYNRLRDVITYIVGATTESRMEAKAGLTEEQNKSRMRMAKLGYVEITENEYRRITLPSLRAEILQSMKNRYRGQDITKAQLEKMADDETVNRVMLFAERQSAHSNFNTSRGFGNKLIWNKSNNPGLAAFVRTSALFRLYPWNVLAAWRTDIGITARRLAAEGEKASVAMVTKYKSMAYSVVASMLLGGGFGPPMLGALADFLSWVWNQLVNRFRGTPRVTDIRKDFINWTYKTMGQYPARFVAAGIFGITPLYGFGAQLSMGEGPVQIDTDKSVSENVANVAFGANLGMVEGAMRGGKRVMRGDVVGGAANILLPAGASKAVDAFYNGTYTPNRVIPEWNKEFYQMSPAEKIVAAAGITPYKSTLIYDQDAENRKLTNARKALMRKMQDAYAEGNLTESNWNELQKWNEAMIEREREDMVAEPRLEASDSRIERDIMNQQRVDRKRGK